MFNLTMVLLVDMYSFCVMIRVDVSTTNDSSESIHLKSIQQQRKYAIYKVMDLIERSISLWTLIKTWNIILQEKKTYFAVLISLMRRLFL